MLSSLLFDIQDPADFQLRHLRIERSQGLATDREFRQTDLSNKTQNQGGAMPSSNASSAAPAASWVLSDATRSFDDICPRRVALFVAGESPQIISETVSMLMRGDDTQGRNKLAFVPTEIRIITTQGSSGDYRERYRGTYGEKIDECLAAYGVTGVVVHVHFIGKKLALTEKAPTRFRCFELFEHDFDETAGSLSDLRNRETNIEAADYIIAVVRELTDDAKSAIHASIAGGRKTMSFFLGKAMSLLARPQDTLSHVLVHPTIEEKNGFFEGKQFWYLDPGRTNRHPDDSQPIIDLVQLDFMRVGPCMARQKIEEKSYSELVSIVNNEFAKTELTVDLTTRRIVCGDVEVRLPLPAFAFYAVLAMRAKTADGNIHAKSFSLEAGDGVRFLAVLLDLTKHNIDHGEQIIRTALSNYLRLKDTLKNWYDTPTKAAEAIVRALSTYYRRSGNTEEPPSRGCMGKNNGLKLWNEKIRVLDSLYWDVAQKGLVSVKTPSEGRAETHLRDRSEATKRFKQYLREQNVNVVLQNALLLVDSKYYLPRKTGSYSLSVDPEEIVLEGFGGIIEDPTKDLMQYLDSAERLTELLGKAEGKIRGRVWR